MHKRINAAPPGPWQENNFSQNVGYVRRGTLVGPEVNHGGMIQSGYLRQGQAASHLKMLFPDLLCKLPASMTVSTLVWLPQRERASGVMFPKKLYPTVTDNGTDSLHLSCLGLNYPHPPKGKEEGAMGHIFCFSSLRYSFNMDFLRRRTCSPPRSYLHLHFYKHLCGD